MHNRKKIYQVKAGTVRGEHQKILVLRHPRRPIPPPLAATRPRQLHSLDNDTIKHIRAIFILQGKKYLNSKCGQ